MIRLAVSLPSKLANIHTLRRAAAHIQAVDLAQPTRTATIKQFTLDYELVVGG